MARATAQPIAQLRAVDITDRVLSSDVISHGPGKTEIEGEYVRVYPMWSADDRQRMPASVLMPIAAIPAAVEKLLAVLGHRPVWPEKH